MNKVRQILAIIGIVLLAVMYLSTIFFAIFDKSQTMTLFKASIGLTIVIPILIWLYTFFYKIITGHKDENQKASKGEEE